MQIKIEDLPQIWLYFVSLGFQERVGGELMKGPGGRRLQGWWLVTLGGGSRETGREAKAKDCWKSSVYVCIDARNIEDK